MATGLGVCGLRVGGSVPSWVIDATAGEVLAVGSTRALDKYVDPLPRIPVAVPRTSVHPGADYYELTMRERPWRFHRDLGTTMAWGYWAGDPANGSPAKAAMIGLGCLGPTLINRRNRPTVVRYRNQLPSSHPLRSAIDVSLWKNLPGIPPDPPGGRRPWDFPAGIDTRAVPHLHGGFTAPQFDGHPEAWFTPDGRHGNHYGSLEGAAPNEAIYVYTNAQRPTMLWYHDHAMAITRLSMYAGLSGVYVIRDTVEERLGLPQGRYEVPLVLQDRTFNPDGSLFYPAKGVTRYHPRWIPEFFGDTPIVNGKAYPYLAVEPRRYRLRLLNATNSRFFDLWFGMPPPRRERMPFWLIGHDGGLRALPLRLSNIVLAPAERIDVLIDFTDVRPGTHITLMNRAPAPYPEGGMGPPMPEIMRFQVTEPLVGRDSSTPPEQLVPPPLEVISASPATPRRELVLTETKDRAGEVVHTQINRRFFFEAAEETPKIGSTEIWEFVNTTADAHPIHIHLVQFQVHSRQRADTDAYKRDYDRWVDDGRDPAAKPVLSRYLIGGPVPPAPDEIGRKDTFKALPKMVNRIIARFDLPGAVPGIPGSASRTPAEYVHHCHMLEHEDNEMMRPWRLLSP